MVKITVVFSSLGCNAHLATSRPAAATAAAAAAAAVSAAHATSATGATTAARYSADCAACAPCTTTDVSGSAAVAVVAESAGRARELALNGVQWGDSLLASSCEEYVHGLMLLLNAVDMDFPVQAIFLFDSLPNGFESGNSESTAAGTSDGDVDGESKGAEAKASKGAAGNNDELLSAQELARLGWSESLCKKLGQMDLYEVPCLAAVFDGSVGSSDASALRYARSVQAQLPFIELGTAQQAQELIAAPGHVLWV